MRTMLLGGDGRTLFLSQLFNGDGVAEIWGLDFSGMKSADIAHVSDADIVILPYPCFDGEKLRAPLSASSLCREELLEICKGKTVFAGAPPTDFLEAASKNGAKVFNYATEALLKDNAYITAEGALGIALTDMPTEVRGAKILVLGCGRIGRELAMLLKKVGARVTVTATREESRIWTEENGFGFIQTDYVCNADVETYDGIFNTAPRLVFGENEVNRTNPNCLLVELASRPGGMDDAAAKAIGRKFVNAQGLPGKVAPMSAAEIIYREIKRILETEEI